MAPSGPLDTPDAATVGEDHLRGQPTRRLEFRSEELAALFRRQFDEEVQIAIDAIVQLPDGTQLQYWTVTGASTGTVLDTVVEFPTVVDARLLSTVEDTHRLEVQVPSHSLFSTVDAFGGVLRSAVYDEHRYHVVVDFPDEVSADDVEAAVTDLYPDFELVSSTEIRTLSVLQPLIEEQLTDRQRTALRLAYFGGYYEEPRRSTGRELAERMGISRQAFHEHLRKAYASLFEQLLAGDEPTVEVDQ